jgi:hypothetical protein
MNQFDQFKQLSPEDQGRLRAKQREFKKRSMDEQKRLRKRYQQQNRAGGQGSVDQLKRRGHQGQQQRQPQRSQQRKSAPGSSGGPG